MAGCLVSFSQSELLGMRGNFICSTCKAANVDIKVLYRNTRRKNMDQATEDAAMRIDLQVFHQGNLVFAKPNFATVPPGGIAELSKETWPELYADNREYTIVGRCGKGDASNELFPQEHQLMYENPRTRTYASVMFDQLPIPRPGKTPNPIILLAHKVWVGARTNTFIIFAHTWEGDPGQRPLEVTLLNTAGTILHRTVRDLAPNESFIFDARAAIGQTVTLQDQPTFFNVVARGGYGAFAIYTIVRDDTTGNCALEHSLPPPYYMDGDITRVREEAMVF